MIRLILALAIAATALTTQSCNNRPDRAYATQLATRLSVAVNSDSLPEAADDITAWLAAMDTVQAVEARQLLMLNCHDMPTRAVMLTLLYDPQWAGWEAARLCCDSLIADTAVTRLQIITSVTLARDTYASRNMLKERDTFDTAFQRYIDQLPVERQMTVYRRVASIPRLARAVSEMAATNPAEAIGAIEALRKQLNEKQFNDFMTIYQQQ